MASKLDFDALLNMILNSPNEFVACVNKDPNLLEMKWSDSETLLHFLLVERKYEEVKLLAKLGANLNPLKNEGGTPLHSAILGNDYEGVKLMLDLGADTSIKNKAHCNAAQWAEFVDVDSAIQELLN